MQRRLVAGVLILAAVASTVVASNGSAAGSSRAWANPDQTPAQRALELLAAMSLADKVTLLHGVDTSAASVPTVGYIPPIPALGVPGITMTDGPAGVRNGQPATELPAPIAEAASWDLNTAKAYGTVAGADARDLGQDQLFGPSLNIDRNPADGRNFEYFSEDPLLSGSIAGADVQGVQSQGVIATIKHYVANNQETNRLSISANIGDRTLHEIYEKNFGIAVATGDPGSVMCSFNKINEVYSCGNQATLDDALRAEFGFTGYVVSDYPATHSVADLNAGLNVELPTGRNITLASVQAALADGTITQSTIEHRVYEILVVLFAFGLFDRNPQATSPINQGADDTTALSVEEHGAVLLKDDSQVLPLTKSGSTIAVIGAPAKTSAQGGGSSQVQPLTVDNAYTALVGPAGPGTTISYDDGSDPARAARAAAAAQVAVVFVRDNEKEGSDRTSLALPGNQDALISAVAAANPHTVVVLETGGPVLMPWLASVPAVLEAWYPGARGGAAIAALLYGDVNPSGHLQQTWPATAAQLPAGTTGQYPGANGEQSYSEGIYVGYRWYDAQHQSPLFPFGYGLSYTSFGYSQLSLGAPSGSSSDGVAVSFTVTNTGTRTGADAPQVYVDKPHALAATPPRELGAFTKITLKPGQSQRVSLTVPAGQLSYWDTGAQAFTVPDGQYGIDVGDSSRTLPLHTSYSVTSSLGPVQLAAAAPTTARPAGSSFNSTATITNRSDFADDSATISVTAPAGWVVTPSTQLGSIAPGQAATASLSITVPPATPGGGYSVEVTARGMVAGHAVSVGQSVPVAVPYPSVAAAYDTVGLTANNNPAAGNWDAYGSSYSADGLAAAGITPGAVVKVGATSVRFPTAAPGTADAVTARGQTIALSGHATRLVLLGAATFGAVAAPATVTYTDHTTAKVTIDLNDWFAGAALGASSVIATVSRNSAAGAASHPVSIYGQVVPIDSSKALASITLPQASNLHLFTIGP